MLAFSLESPTIITNISYAGDGVVLLSIYDKEAGVHDLMPFSFLTKSKAYEYIVTFTSRLLTEQKFKIVVKEE